MAKSDVMLIFLLSGLHALALHFSLVDIEARAFARPFCLAYLARNGRKLVANFQKLRLAFEQLIEPMKLCNKRNFRADLREALSLLDGMETATVSSYYELYYNSNNTESTSASETEQQTVCILDCLHFMIRYLSCHVI